MFYFLIKKFKLICYFFFFCRHLTYVNIYVYIYIYTCVYVRAEIIFSHIHINLLFPKSIQRLRSTEMASIKHFFLVFICVSVLLTSGYILVLLSC